MRKVYVDQLKEGMIISKPIYTHNGIILLNEGAKLTKSYISKIRKIGLKYIYIQDKISEGIQIQEVISEETRNETKEIFNKNIEALKNTNILVSEDLIRQVDKIINEILLNPSVQYSLYEMRNNNDYLASHSINVCIISLLIGKKMDFLDSQLMQLGIGALLHDIGKLNIDFNCYRYRDDYIEKERVIYNEHSQEGYDLIRDLKDISLLTSTIVRTHHENYDGSGFPLGLKGDAIHIFAKIVAVANEFDNLHFNLPNKNMKNHEIIEYITSKAYTCFDPEVIKVFKSVIVPYPVSTGVILSDGRIGIVSKINETIPNRPIVRIIDTENNKIIEEIDLSKVLSIVIQDEIDIDK